MENNLSHLSKTEKIELIKLLEQKQLSEADKMLLKFDPSLIQAEVLCSKAKIRIILGSNRSGKSEVGGVDTLVRSTGIVPLAIADRYPMDMIKLEGNVSGQFYLASALDFPSSRNISQAKIEKFCPKSIYQGFNKEDRKLFLKSNNTILFKSQESGREKYQGISCWDIWLDEEHKEDVYDECYMRTTDCSGNIKFTFTPVEGLTWSYQKLYKKAKYYIQTINIHGIDEEVGKIHKPEEIPLLKERKLVIIPNTSEEADDDIVVFQMSIYDNKHLPDAEIWRAEKKYASDPASYNARILGRFTKLTGKNVFDIESLLKAQSHCPSTFQRGEIVQGQFKSSVKGRLVIFTKDLKKERGCYIIGADVAEGGENGDYSCIQVLDRRTCEQVAVWHGHCSPDQFASILYDIGRFFNYAYLAPERNFHGYGVVSTLRDKKYLRLYYDRDKAAEVLKNQHTGHKTYGWETNGRTKPIMVQTLANYIRNKHIKINDIQTIDELITFVYDKDGHTNAMGGCFDDRVMALAIALQLYESTPIYSIEANPAQIKPTNINKITGY